MCSLLVDCSKHMTTCKCGVHYCHACLKTKDSAGKWQCGGPFEACTVAPVQTTLPGATTVPETPR